MVAATGKVRRRRLPTSRRPEGANAALAAAGFLRQYILAFATAGLTRCGQSPAPAASKLAPNVTAVGRLAQKPQVLPGPTGNWSATICRCSHPASASGLTGAGAAERPSSNLQACHALPSVSVSRPARPSCSSCFACGTQRSRSMRPRKEIAALTQSMFACVQAAIWS